MNCRTLFAINLILNRRLLSKMFSEMIKDLQSGSEPALPPIRQRLQAAMVKKLAMMRLNKEFQHNDSKINPETEHMLWAAILLEDHDAVETLASILLTEAYDRYEAQRGAMDAPTSPPDPNDVLSSCAHKLVTISSQNKLQKLVKEKIQKATIFKELPVD